jgi:subtilisin family serine protease
VSRVAEPVAADTAQKGWIVQLRRLAVPVLAAVLIASATAQQQGLIVRDSVGFGHLSFLCSLLQCNVVRGLGDPQRQTFLVAPAGIDLVALLQLLQIQTGIVNAELDQLLNLETPPLSFIPNGLSDTVPVNYQGASVWDGYVNQPANLIVRTLETQSQFHVSGAGIVAMIDTGLDPRHPALAPIVLPGYDFTRNISGADETGDLDHSTAAVLDGGGNGIPIYVTPGLAAVLPPVAAAALGSPQYAAFGHGTMTAGIVHMVAPTAKILPLKAFSSSGAGNLSDVVRAVYFAASQGSSVISMSFEFQNYSPEMANAISYASSLGVVSVASAGNDGQEIVVYPASLSTVIGVASTSDTDTRSSFTNYGSQVVWVAAPGENIVSTYPYGTYSASSGTSFSAPIVSGTVALLLSGNRNVIPSSAASAIAHARQLSSDLNHGRLDTYLAVGSVAQLH